VITDFVRLTNICIIIIIIIVIVIVIIIIIIIMIIIIRRQNRYTAVIFTSVFVHPITKFSQKYIFKTLWVAYLFDFNNSRLQKKHKTKNHNRFYS